MTTVLDTTLVGLTNIMNHTVVYKIEEDKIRRVFHGNETKKVPASEIRKLNYRYGGQVLLNNHLRVENKALREELNIQLDVPEYEWTPSDVDRVLTTGSMDELLDALDFAPTGIVDMLVSRAIELKINDVNKRKAIQKATGKNVDQAISFVEEAEKETPQKEVKTRRVRSEEAVERAKARRLAAE
jgi:hypothetical protein